WKKGSRPCRAERRRQRRDSAYDQEQRRRQRVAGRQAREEKQRDRGDRVINRHERRATVSIEQRAGDGRKEQSGQRQQEGRGARQLRRVIPRQDEQHQRDREHLAGDAAEAEADEQTRESLDLEESAIATLGRSGVLGPHRVAAAGLASRSAGIIRMGKTAETSAAATAAHRATSSAWPISGPARAEPMGLPTELRAIDTANARPNHIGSVRLWRSV